VALLTLGEGYHSFHHRFPADFRNGIRWYHWDPAKWFIASLRGVGLASDLRSATPPQIEGARMHAALHSLEPRLAVVREDVAADVHRLIADARTHLDASLALWRQHAEERARNASSAWRRTRQTARQHLREARRRWQEARRLAVWPAAIEPMVE
jgi:stearoyl-CoA desaturase (delta-9 desaturase)